MRLLRQTSVMGVLFAACCILARAESASIILESHASPRVQFGAEQLSRALKEAGLSLAANKNDATNNPDHLILIAHSDHNLTSIQRLVSTGLLKTDLTNLAPEGFVVGSWGNRK